MEIFSRDVSQMYFAKILGVDLPEISLDGNTMKVLMAIDENKTGSQIAAATGLAMPAFQKCIVTLVKLGVIKTVEKKVEVLGEEFLDDLQSEFASVVGPMADVLIDDVISDMDLSLLTVPVQMAPDLVNNLAALIPAAEKRAEFQKTMIQKIKG